MTFNERIFKLKGVVQHYAWGGLEFIPSLLGEPNKAEQPCAEYWMGAHPSAPSLLLLNQEWVSLKKLIDEHPNQIITSAVQDRFGELPYLFKVLDVSDMLSIQVHPTKAEAEKGFDAEEAAGIALNAPNRNYKDRNHKPEVMVALSEFWLLHGFKKTSILADTIEMNIELSVLLPLFKKEGIKALYQFVMEMDQSDVNAVLMPLVKKALRLKLDGSITKTDPAWWAAKLYEKTGIPENIDRGIFSIYFFNIVKVNPGEAVFQKAGVPHAYLEGQNIELMANSDNVLRAGLTPKHVDVAELMKHTLFEEVIPDIMQGKPIQRGERVYPCPVADFGISKIDLSADHNFAGCAYSLEILIVTAGGMVVNNKLALKRGEVVAMLPGAEYNLTASGTCTLFKAFVPSL
ncbi:MAG: mannose-6-phosphate isomerase, class I [Sphingobacteriia bacterium]|nr:MAG: mannose-6-phosphate isomerase, class I [Sphingobacteriia bacterium]